jgi:hypothetical protein
MKVVINRCWGGFSVSAAVLEELGLEDKTYGYLYNDDFGIKDADPEAYRAAPKLTKLIEAIEKVGIKEASGDSAELKIVDIPDDVEAWYIHDYDGMETLHEEHRSWA